MVVIMVTLLTLEIGSNLLFRRKLRQLLAGPMRGKARVDAIVETSKSLNSRGRYMAGGFLLAFSIVYLLIARGEVSFMRGFFTTVYTIPIVIMLFLRSSNMTDNIRQKGMIKMVKENFDEGDSAVIEDLLAALGQMGKVREQAVAVMGLEKWGSPESMDTVEEIHRRLAFSDAKNVKEVVDLAKKVHGDLSREIRSLDINRTETFVPLVEKRIYWKRLAQASATPDPLALKKLMDPDLLQYAPEQFFIRHHEMYHHQDEVMCTTCNTRMEVIHWAKIPMGRCRICHEVAPLARGARKIVGVIGPRPLDLDTDHNQIIDLWNAQDEVPRYADIDELHISAGADINYDWAIAAVVEQQVNERPEHFGSVELYLDPQIQLSNNARAQLRVIGQSSLAQV